MRIACGFLLGLVLALPVAAGEAVARDWYETRGTPPPNGNRVYVCHGYTCRIVTPVQLSAGEIGHITAPLSENLADAAAERAALSRVVQIYEEIVGSRIGTSGDLAGMQFGRGADGQMDCIDEATNTTSLLRLLSEQGYLRHHQVREPTARGFFLDGRYPHATAVLAEIAGGEKWAIDSWPRANAEPPVIQPLSEWFRGRGGQIPS